MRTGYLNISFFLGLTDFANSWLSRNPLKSWFSIVSRAIFSHVHRVSKRPLQQTNLLNHPKLTDLFWEYYINLALTHWDIRMCVITLVRVKPPIRCSHLSGHEEIRLVSCSVVVFDLEHYDVIILPSKWIRACSIDLVYSDSLNRRPVQTL